MPRCPLRRESRSGTVFKALVAANAASYALLAVIISFVGLNAPH